MKRGYSPSGSPCPFRKVLLLLWFSLLPLGSDAAESPGGPLVDLHSSFGHRAEDPVLVPLEVSKSLALGVQRFQLDGRNQVLGWKLSDRWYFGRQRGDDSGLALVWQHQQTRFSLTRSGVRITRSF